MLRYTGPSGPSQQPANCQTREWGHPGSSGHHLMYERAQERSAKLLQSRRTAQLTQRIMSSINSHLKLWSLEWFVIQQKLTNTDWKTKHLSFNRDKSTCFFQCDFVFLWEGDCTILEPKSVLNRVISLWWSRPSHSWPMSPSGQHQAFLRGNQK